jgi:hypothetical protein
MSLENNKKKAAKLKKRELQFSESETDVKTEEKSGN